MLKAFNSILPVGLLFFSASVWAQIGLVHATNCGPAAFPGAVCAIPATQSGNLVVVGFQVGGGADTSTTIAAVTDNAGNTYLEAGPARAVDTAGGSVVDIWYARNIAPGATSVIVTPGSSVTNGGAVIWEFSGVDASAPLDQTAVRNSQMGATNLLGAAVATTSPVEVVISIAAVSGDVTGVGNAFTTDSALKGNGWAHFITSSPGTYAAQWNETPAGTYASSTVSFKAASLGGVRSACDLNQDGTVNIIDGQLAINMYLGLLPCTANIVGPGVCNPDLVQRVMTAAMGSACVTSSGATLHSVTLNWIGSSSGNLAGYNIYRSATSGGPYTKLNSSPVIGTNYIDGAVQSGQTYYYVATAVDNTRIESAYSTEAQAVVPFP